jgi:hypothetical protein
MPSRRSAVGIIAAMRAMLSIALACAACGDNTGLVLTVGAPPGMAAARLELVLASPEAADVSEQRTGGDARYYRQKSTAGELGDLPASLDGFVIRIEGRDGKGDEPFVPFAIAYGASGPIAAGAVLDPEGLPLALEIPSSSRIEATVTLLPLAAVDPMKGIAAGQLAELPCTRSNRSWRSGLAWQPAAGPQLRLLLPDPEGEAPLDATRRSLDLDCDGHPADGGDCDDVHVQYNPAAAERCDGADMNCDGSRFAVTGCLLPDTSCGALDRDGVQLCRDDGSGSTIGDCLGSPECRCRPGYPGTDPCSKCELAFEAEAGPAAPCAPAVAKVAVGPCDTASPCTVEVVQDDGPWAATVAPEPRGDFGQRAVVTGPDVYLRVKAGVTSLPAAPGASVGAVHLVITRPISGVPRYLGFDLALAGSKVASCSSVSSPTLPAGYFGMTCQ